MTQWSSVIQNLETVPPPTPDECPQPVSRGRDIRFLSLLQTRKAGKRPERDGLAGGLPGQEPGPCYLAGQQQSQGLPEVIYQTMTTFNVRSAIISFILIQSFPVELSRAPTAIFNRGIFFLLRLDTVITVELSVFVEGKLISFS